MLTLQNLPDLLTALGFTMKGRQFTKVIGAGSLQVFLDKQQIVLSRV